MKPTPDLRRVLAEQNREWPPYLVEVPRSQWPSTPQRLLEVWRSRTFVVQVCEEQHGAQRVSVNRTALDASGRWRDGISWDALQEVKRQIGRADRWAVEIYPPDADIENVANMRHLWLIPEPAFGFRPRGRR